MQEFGAAARQKPQSLPSLLTTAAQTEREVSSSLYCYTFLRTCGLLCIGCTLLQAIHVAIHARGAATSNPCLIAQPSLLCCNVLSHSRKQSAAQCSCWDVIDTNAWRMQSLRQDLSCTYLAQHGLESLLDATYFYKVTEGRWCFECTDRVICIMQLQQACLLAELLLAVMLQHLAESDGDPSALSRLGDNRVSLHVPRMQVCACFL